MAGGRWHIQTPLGEFRLEVKHSGGRFPTSEEHVRAQHVWFFAERELHHLSPVAIEAAIELCEELGSARDWRALRNVVRTSAESLAQELKLALLSGRLVFSEIPRVHAWGAGAGAPESSESEAPRPIDEEWIPPKPAPKKQVSEDAWIELELLDPQGEPIPNQSLRVLQQQQIVWEGRTDAMGLIRIERLLPGTCDIEFL